MKQVAPFRQYQVLYSGGQGDVWNVMLGRAVGTGGRGLGVDRLEHASVNKQHHLVGYQLQLRVMFVSALTLPSHISHPIHNHRAISLFNLYS